MRLSLDAAVYTSMQISCSSGPILSAIQHIDDAGRCFTADLLKLTLPASATKSAGSHERPHDEVVVGLSSGLRLGGAIEALAPAEELELSRERRCVGRCGRTTELP